MERGGEGRDELASSPFRQRQQGPEQGSICLQREYVTGNIFIYLLRKKNKKKKDDEVISKSHNQVAPCGLGSRSKASCEN